MKLKRNNKQIERFRKARIVKPKRNKRTFRKAKKTEIKRAMKRSKKKHSEMFKKLAEH